MLVGNQSRAADALPAAASLSKKGCTPNKVLNFTVKGGTADFTVEPDSCNTKITFSSYKLPGGYVEPFEDQVLFDSKTADYSPGDYTVNIGLPACSWQSDLYFGDVQEFLIPNVGHKDLIPGWSFDVSEGDPCDTPAVAVADTITVDGGQSATIDVLANDGGTTGKTVASTGGSASNGTASWSGSNLTFTGGYSINTVESEVTYTLASGSSTTVTLILLGQGSPSLSVNVTATPGRGEAMNCSRFAPPSSALRQVPGSATPSWSPMFSYPLYSGVSGSLSGSSNYLYGAPVAVANSQSLLTPSGTETVGGVTYSDYSVSNGTFRYLPRPNVRQYSSNAALLMQGDNPLVVRPSPLALWFNQQFDVPYYFPDGTYVGTQRMTSNAFVGSYISAAVCPSKPEGNVVTVTVDPSVIRAGSTSVSLTSASTDAIFSQTLLNVLPADRPQVPASLGSVSFAGNVMTFTPARNLRGISLPWSSDIPFKVTNPDGIVGDGTLRIIYTAMPSNAT